MVDVRWMWVFLDTVAPQAPPSWSFWEQVTRSTMSPRRGERGEFATLVPAAGAAWIKLQAVGRPGPGAGVHLDLDVVDRRAAAADALALGARVVGGAGGGEGGYVALVSPGGMGFCLTTWRDQDAAQVRAGEADLLDQVCLDLPDDVHEAEIAFWRSLTGWTWQPSDVPEFSFLVRPAEQPVRLLFQHLGEPSGAVRAHVDLACVDRKASRAAHEAAGASVVDERSFWTVLRDPVGRHYCLTDRTPVQDWVRD